MSQVRRTRLPSGLTVLCEPLHHAPVVALQAWVSVGAADETPEQAGIAHLHEHMLFKGTARRGVGEIARTVEASGGEINAWTSFDETVYHLVLAAEQLDTGLDILADVMRASAFDADELAREIEVVVEEIQRAKDSPSRRVANALFATAYTRHPYRRPILGTETTVRAFSREGILDFYRAHYRPERTTLVVVGDVDPDLLIARVEHFFGPWLSRQAAPASSREPARDREPPQEKLRATILAESVKEARLSVAWHTPPLKHDDTVALDALSLVLGYGDSSRLMMHTRRRLGIVNDVYASAYTPRDPGLFVVGAGLRAEHGRAALTSLLDETYRLRHQLVPAAELEKVRVVLLSEAAYQREVVQGEARKLGFFEVAAGDYAYEESYLQAVKDLKPGDLREVAHRYLDDAPTVIAQLPQETVTLSDADLATVVAERFAADRSAPRHRRARGALDVVCARLDNGATILVRHEPGTPVVGLRAVAKGGLRYETAGNCGIGTLFGATFALATEDSPPDVLAERMALLGGSVAAFAGRNTLGLRGEFIREKASEGLELFCDALLRPAFHQTDFERERDAILERIRNRDDSPASVCYDTFVEALYPAHPYGLRITGTEESVSRFAAGDLEPYRQRFLSPDKLVVAVAGNFDPARALDLLSEELGSTPGEALPPPLPPDPPPAGLRRVRHALAKAQTHIIVGGMGTTVDHADRFALEVLCTILSGQSGRLFVDLRDKQSLAYAVSSGNVEGIDPGHVMVHIATSPEKTEQALAGIYRHLDAIRTEPVTPAELERAQNYLAGTHAIELQRCGARAMSMALNECLGLGYDAYAHYAGQIRAVDAAAVLAAARRYFDPHRLVEAVVGPAADA